MALLPRFYILCLDALLLLGMARLIRYSFKRKEEDGVAVVGTGKRKSCVSVHLSACEYYVMNYI